MLTKPCRLGNLPFTKTSFQIYIRILKHFKFRTTKQLVFDIDSKVTKGFNVSYIMAFCLCFTI